MTDPDAPPVPSTPAVEGAAPGEGAREPAASPQRHLVETISAYEVDPPPPARVDDGEPDA